VTGTRRKTTDAPREDLLNISPFEGDLAEELAADPSRGRRLPSVTVLLGAGVLLVGGFAGGVQADKHWGANKPADPAALIRQFAAGRGGQGGAGGFGGFGGGQGRGLGGGQGAAQGRGQGQGGGQDAGTSGTVKLVDGDVIYVQTPNGIVRVKTTGSTKVTVAKKSKLTALKAGSTVVVQGTLGQDGTVTATSVQGG
jgi:hypothetical protein